MGEELLGNPLEVLNEEDVFDTGLTIGEVVERVGIKKNSSERDKINFHNRIVAMFEDGLTACGSSIF